MRMTNLSKPLQRTDIIHLESSLDFDKDHSNNHMNKILMSQRFSGKEVLNKDSYSKTSKKNVSKKTITKKGSLKQLKMTESEKRFTTESTPLGASKKVSQTKFYNSVKGGRLSENDDRKTFISSTERQVDSISNRSKVQMPKQPFKVKRINKKFPYNILDDHKVSMTPDKHSSKNPDNKIIITKRNDGQKILSKRKKIVLDQKLLYTKPEGGSGRFISHERKVSAIPTSDLNPLPLYMSKQTGSSTSTPLIV